MPTSESILKGLVVAIIEKDRTWKIFSDMHVPPQDRYDYKEYFDHIKALDKYENALARAKGWTGIK